MVTHQCRLCGNDHTRFTCEFCVKSGNFWVYQARFSYSGKKQYIDAIQTEKKQLLSQLSSSIHSSISYKLSNKTLSENIVTLLSQKLEKQALHVKTSKDNADERTACLKERRDKLRKKKDDLALKIASLNNLSASLTRKQSDSAVVKSDLQKLRKDKLIELESMFFSVSVEPTTILNIPLFEVDDLRVYVRKLRGNTGEEDNLNTQVALSFLTQFIETIASLLDTQLLYEINWEMFSGRAKSSKLLSTAVKSLSSNIIQICLTQHVHPELLEPFYFISNLCQLLRDENSCAVGPYFHSLDRPGDSEDEGDVSDTSSESDAEWEACPSATELPDIPPSSSYLGISLSSLWTSGPDQ